jgi:hypothetical protein
MTAALRKAVSRVVARAGARGRKAGLPGALAVVATVSLAWLAYSLAWPVRLPDPSAVVEEKAAPMPARKGLASFDNGRMLIRSKEVFAPPVPILSNSAGAVVLEELLKKVELAGITNLGGQPAAIIRVSGKGAIYKAGDPVGSFILKEVRADKVVLELDGQPVDLAM